MVGDLAGGGSVVVDVVLVTCDRGQGRLTPDRIKKNISLLWLSLILLIAGMQIQSSLRR